MALSRLLPQAELIVVTTPQLMAQKVATRVAAVSYTHLTLPTILRV